MDQFLKRVLPESGEYVAVSIDGAGARDFRGIPDQPSLVKRLQSESLKPVNVYYAVGSYQHDRKHPLAKRSIFVDVDPKGYATKPEQISALAAFCRATNFPAPSIYVDSGNGIHAYWCLDRDMPVVEWKPLAEALKARCIGADFRIDPTVTADPARILRVPGTLNHKGETPIPCRVLKDTGTSYDPAVLLRALVPTATSAGVALARAVGANDLSSDPDATSYPQVPYYATEIAEKCGVLKEALVNGGFDHTEPQWRHLLSILSYTVDGDQLIHEISKGHPGYSVKATEAKYALILKGKAEGKIKPILCSTFAGYRKAICEACPHFGKIKTPMTLGRLEEVAYLSYPYKMADYSIQKLVKKGDPDNDVPDVYRDVVPYRISDVEMLDPGPDGEMQIQMLLSSKGTVIKFIMQHGALFGDNTQLSETLKKFRVWIDPAQQTEFRGIMTSWIRKMTDVKKAVSIELEGLGWGMRGGQHAFVAGGRAYTEDGKDHEFHCDSGKIKPFRPRGKIDSWQTVANALAADPRQEAVVTLLTAFAAPLVKFTGVKGVTYSLYSPESATGKSTLLKAAQAVWGHPVDAMSMVDDTQNSVINRIGFLSTTPVYWDELRGGEQLKNFVKMIIFTLGQGRERGRLNSGLKQQDRGTWDTLMTLASNERISDHVNLHITNTDAGRVRIFECRLPKFEPATIEVQRCFTKLETNFGHAGVIYAKYLVTHYKDVEKLMQQTQEAIKRMPTVVPSERYWVAFVTSIVCAAILVKRAGLLSIDTKALNHFLFVQMAVQKIGVVNNYAPPKQVALDSISTYIDEHRDQMLLVETFNGAGMSKFGNILTPANQFPRNEINILKAVHEKKIRIRWNTWNKWVVNKMGNSPQTILEELSNLGAVKAQRDMSAGIEAASTARVWVIEIDLASAGFAAVAD